MPIISRLKQWAVVQIDPAAAQQAFGGCFLTVTDVGPWGVSGFVQVPGNPGHQAHLSLPWSYVKHIGQAHWRPHDGQYETRAQGYGFGRSDRRSKNNGTC